MSYKNLKDDVLIKFIRSYKEKECLWNKRSVDYNNIMYKIKSYNQLSKEFDMNGLEIKRLINNLQTCFIREFDIVSVSKKRFDRELYKPQIKWYTEMFFLVDILQTRKNHNVDNEHDNVEYMQEEEVFTVPNYPSIDAMKYVKLSSDIHISEQKLSVLESNTTKARVTNNDIAENHIFSETDESDVNDEIDQFCNSLAIQLMKLPVRSMIQLQMEIQNLISNKRLEELTNTNSD